MSTFLGQFSHSIGQTIGQSLGNSIGQSLANATPEELRVGSHYVLVREKIAEGGFGVIELVVDTQTQQKEMVLKRCNVDRPEVFEIVKKEVNILQKFKGPYIVSLIDNDVAMRNSAREAYILLENCPGGHLLTRLNERHGQPLPAESIYRIFGQILLGIKALHENRPPIIHRDIKLENILFGMDGKVRLCDFGSCLEAPIYLRNVEERNRAEESIAKETTQMYRAPEMVDLYMRNQLTEKSDIWAFGCVFFALCYLKHPFQDAGSLGILAGKYSIPAQGGTVSEDAVTLLRRMLDIDPEARPSVLELLLAMREVAKGAPLPEYTLSTEAQQRRAERLAADEVRKTKAKKKVVANPIDTKRSAPPSSNSVAAKRLAAKRGVTSDNPQSLSSSSAMGEDLFGADTSFQVDAFGNNSNDSAASDHVAGFDPFADPVDNSNFATSDDWGSTASAAKGSSTVVRKPSFSADANNDDDFFAPTSALSTAPAVARSSFAAATTSEFDPFADSTITHDSHSTKSAPATTAKVSVAAEFDPFATDNQNAVSATDDFQATQSTASVAAMLFTDIDETPSAPAAGAKPSRPSFTAAATSNSDGFDMFDNSLPVTPAVPAATGTPAPSSAMRRPSGPAANTNNNNDDQFFDAFAPTVTASSSSLPSSHHNSARNSFTATSHAHHTAFSSTTSNYQSANNSAHHADDLLFAASAGSSATSELSSSSTANINNNNNNNSNSSSGSIFDDLPTTPLQPVRMSATTPVASHDLLDVGVHPSYSQSNNVNSFASGSSGKSTGPLDVLSLYDMPKPEPPLKPMRSGNNGLGGGMAGGMPPPQALGYNSMGLGGGRPMPNVPMGSHQHHMMMNTSNTMGNNHFGFNNNNNNNMMNTMNSSSAVSNSNRPMAMGGGNAMMNNSSMNNRMGAGSYRPTTSGRSSSDPFDSLNQFKK